MRAWWTAVSMVLVSGLPPALAPALAAQEPAGERRLHVGPAAAYMVYGTYFEGPGDVGFSTGNGPAFGAAADFHAGRGVSVVAAVHRASSDWSFTGVPLLGRVDVDGAELWLADVGLRLTARRWRVRPFVQLGLGAVRYRAENALIDERATNVAAVGGVGVTAALGRRLRAELLLKDYYSSFRSVDAVAQVGAEGRRAHTLGIGVGLALGL